MQSFHIAKGWRSCRGGRVHGPKPSLPTPCCAASLNTAVAPKPPLPFGGAIVAKLAGSAKILKGEHHLVPLLGPGQWADGEPQLPFGASVECVRRSPLEAEFRSPEAAASISSSGILTDDDAASASSRMLDVLYVLAGSGIATTADGTVRKLHAGDSLVAWHNSCELRALSPDDQPPAVLKFHFPASVLMLPPGAVVAPSPSHADLQILVHDCQGAYDGELSPQEAADMLSGVQQRAAQAIAQLYNNQQIHPGQQEPGLAVQPPDALGRGHSGAGPEASVAAATAAPSGVASAPSSRTTTAAANNILPVVVPFLRRLFHGATAPAADGVRLLRSALRQHAAGRGALAPAAVAATAATAAAAVAAPAAASAQAHHHHQQQQARVGCGSFAPLGLSATASSTSSSSGCVLLQRALEEFKAFRFPRQTNKLAFVFDPTELGLSLSFGVEVFEPRHHTPLHIHKAAHELFFVLAGEGLAFCNGVRFPVAAGDCVVFPPRAVHGIDNTSDSDKLYCLQLMTPNEAFVEHVQSGEAVGRLDDEDLCNLTSRHC